MDLQSEGVEGEGEAKVASEHPLSKTALSTSQKREELTAQKLYIPGAILTLHILPDQALPQSQGCWEYSPRLAPIKTANSAKVHPSCSRAKVISPALQNKGFQ